MSLKGNALIFLSVKHRKLANKIIRSTKHIKSYENLNENKYTIYSFKPKLKIAETKVTIKEPIMEIDLLNNLTNDLKTYKTPTLTHAYLVNEAKKKGASKIIAKTWIFLQNPKIANRLGYQRIDGTGVKLIKRLGEISKALDENPHILGVNFIKKRLVVKFGKQNLEIDLNKYPLPYYYHLII